MKMEQEKCPICREKVNVKDGKIAVHAKSPWNNLILKLGPEYRCLGSGMDVKNLTGEDK